MRQGSLLLKLEKGRKDLAIQTIMSIEVQQPIIQSIVIISLLIFRETYSVNNSVNNSRVSWGQNQSFIYNYNNSRSIILYSFNTNSYRSNNNNNFSSRSNDRSVNEAS